MGTNCAPFVVDLFLFCYEKDFMTSLSDKNQADIIDAFNSTSRYLDDLLNIDNPYFEGMVNQIYPPELQLNRANTSDTEVPFLDLHLSFSNGFVSSKMNDKREDFAFVIVNFPFLDFDVPRRPYNGYKIFFSKSTWPIKAKFYVEPPWECETKVCINGPGHMTKMAATPMYGKNL